MNLSRRSVTRTALFKRLIPWASAGVLTLLSTTAAASDLSDQLDAMRNEILTTGSAPGRFETQRRGGVTGGHFSMRTPRVQKQPWYQVNLPSITAGCQGIDLYGGSFSLISESQLREQLRAMGGSQVLTHALGVALDIMAPTLSAEMKRLQGIMNQWNDALQDECWAAEQFTALSGMDAAAERSRRRAQEEGTALGRFNDRLEGMLSDQQKGDGDLTETELKNSGINENWIWKAMEEADIAGMTFPGGYGGDMRETMMSLTGTIVVVHKANADGDQEPNPSYYPPSLSPRDLIYGISDTEATRLVCEDDETHCLEVKQETHSDAVPGLQEIVLQEFFIGGGGGGRPLFEQLSSHQPGDELNTNQRALLRAANTPTAALLRTMAIRGDQPAAGSEAVIADWLAYEIADLYITTLYDLAMEIARNRENGASYVESHLRPWREQQMEELKKVREGLEAISLRYAHHNDVREAMSAGEPLTTTAHRARGQKQN